MAARAALEQGPDPHRVPQHHLLRPRCVRHPAGGAGVLQEEREGADAAGVGAPRGHSRGPVALRPCRQPAQRHAPTAARALDDARAAEDHVASVQARRQGAAPRPGGHPAPGNARPGAVLRQLREGRPRRALRRGPRVRRRPEGDDDDRHGAAAEGARRDREDPREPRRPGRGTRRDRPAERRGQGDVRRPELPSEPVQPRRAGEAAARVPRSSRSSSRRRWTRGSRR